MPTSRIALWKHSKNVFLKGRRKGHCRQRGPEACKYSQQSLRPKLSGLDIFKLNASVTDVQWFPSSLSARDVARPKGVLVGGRWDKESVEIQNVRLFSHSGRRKSHDRPHAVSLRQFVGGALVRLSIMQGEPALYGAVHPKDSRPCKDEMISPSGARRRKIWSDQFIDW